MITQPYEALLDVGYTWQTWGGEYGGQEDPVHFQLPGIEEDIKKHLRNERWAQTGLGYGIDILLNFVPVVGAVETFATIASFYPPWSHSPLLEFLSGPGSYLLNR